MRRFRFLLVGVLILSLCGLAAAQDEKKTKKMMKPMMAVKDMPMEKQIKIAESAAPAHISKDATIMAIGMDGKLMEARKGTNGWTCLPDIDEQETPDPVCADAASMQWMNDFMNNVPKPTNTVPGIAYMGKGGWHWEKDGKVVMDKNTPGAKRVMEPPHWMILWPLEPMASGLPTYPDKFGTYIMYEGTPYAHLMVYQNPHRMNMPMMEKMGKPMMEKPMMDKPMR